MIVLLLWWFVFMRVPEWTLDVAGAGATLRPHRVSLHDLENGR